MLELVLEFLLEVAFAAGSGLIGPFTSKKSKLRAAYNAKLLSAKRRRKRKAVARWIKRSNSQRGIPNVGLLCPNCQYRLAGLIAQVCPECGRGFDVQEMVSANGES